MKIGLFLTLALLVSCSRSEPPETIIRTLYDEHKPQHERGIDFDDTQQVARYFSPELTALFAKDTACKEQTKEQCNLGFDPVFAAQDYDDKPLDLAIETLSPTRYKATFTNITRRSLIYDVVETPAGWRVADITYPDSEGSLKALLAQ